MSKSDSHLHISAIDIIKPSWPIFALVVSLSWAVGIIGWALVSTWIADSSLTDLWLLWSIWSGHYLWRGGWKGGGGVGTEEKRVGQTMFWVSKRLSEWKAKQLKGWVIQIYCHFQTKTKILKTKRQCQQSYVNTIWSWGGKWCLQRKYYKCWQHKTLHCIKLHKQLPNSCHRRGKGHVWQPLSYTILLEDLLGIRKWSRKHGGSYAISMTTLPKFPW
jgi:hypothetical protein